jgi:hypothetical protein
MRLLHSHRPRLERSEVHSRNQRDILVYRHWDRREDVLFTCCGTQENGIPRDIVRRNWCPHCNKAVYSAADLQQFDREGFLIYRFRVSRYTASAIRTYSHLIPGADILKRKWDDSGEAVTGFDYHKDHIFSIRDGFEQDVPASVIGSPVNIRVVWWEDNVIKNRKSEMTLTALLDAFETFLSEHPRWKRTAAVIG